jgi:chromosome segregation ATPase
VGSLETGNEGARSQWDVGEIVTKDASQEEIPGKGKEDTDSAATTGAKPEETDGSTEARVSPSTPRSENGDTEPLTCKSEKSAEQQSSDVSESQPAPSDDHNDGPSQPRNNNTDQTLLVEIDSLRQKVSNFELENKLLKREIGSLNDEMGTLITRLNESSDSSSHYEREIQSLREQVSQSDHVIRQLRSHDDDLQSLLEARDQQIAVLRAQLTDGDRTAEQLRVHVSAAQREREQ